MKAKQNRGRSRGDPGGPPPARAWATVALTLLSVALTAAAFPGGPFPWLAWIALAPLFFVLRGVNPFHGFFLGWLFGGMAWMASVWWIHYPLRHMLEMPAPAAWLITLTGCLLNGLSYAVAGYIVARWRGSGFLRGTGRDAAVFTLANTWLALVFPGNLAHSQYLYPAVLQVLGIGGTPLLLFLIYWTNRLLAEAILEPIRFGGFSLKPVAAAGAIPCLVLTFGTIRIHQFQTLSNRGGIRPLVHGWGRSAESADPGAR